MLPITHHCPTTEVSDKRCPKRQPTNHNNDSNILRHMPATFPPHAWNNASKYGSRQQCTSHDNTPALDAKYVKHGQEVIGTLLYYGRASRPSVPLDRHNSKVTPVTLEAITQLLNYFATYPDAIIWYNASDMLLYIESDASYLSKTKGRLRTAGYHYISSQCPKPNEPPADNEPAPPLNGPINVPCKIMHKILSSATEAEIAGLFYNGKEATRK
jgi:hypothetical protein